MFEGVTTYPAIVILSKAIPAQTHNIQSLSLKTMPPLGISAAFEQQALNMPQAQLNGNANTIEQASWQLESSANAALRYKLTQGHPTLKQVYGSPLYGIKTGLNEAFVIDGVTRNRLMAQDAKSANLIKPFLEGKDLKKWRVEPRDLWLIFTRRGTDIDAYPAIKQRLEQFRRQLEPKPKDWKPKSYRPEDKWPGRKPRPYKWFEIQDTINYFNIYEKSKLVYPEISQGAKFSVEDSGLYGNKTVFSLPKFDWYLVGVLNSKVNWHFLSIICSALRGGEWRLMLQSIYVDNIPIPNATAEQRTEIATLAETCQTKAQARLAAQVAFTRRIPDLAGPNQLKLNTKLQQWWLLDFAGFRAEIFKCFKAKIPLKDRNDWHDLFNQQQTQINTFTQQIQHTEQQLNVAVYGLFKLTNTEIALIEGK